MLDLAPASALMYDMPFDNYAGAFIYLKEGDKIILGEDELKVIQKYYSKLSDFIQKEETLNQSHSIDEAQAHHDVKKNRKQELKLKKK